MKNIMKSIFALAAFSAVSMHANTSAKMPVQSSIPNPSARWGVKDGANLFITAEALVCKLAQDTLPYAYSVDDAENITDYHMDFDYKWGFRVAAGYNMSHDKWDVVATYTRFNVSNYSKVEDTAGIELYSYNLTQSATPFVGNGPQLSYAKNTWDVDFNLLDVEQGRQFFVSKFLRIRPKFGLRNLWLENNQHVRALVNDTVTQYPVGLYEMKNNERFWGMGVLAGLDTVWGLAQGFSIYGNVGFSGLFGYFNPKQSITNLGNSNTQHSDKSGHQEVTKATMDLALGLRWDKNFYDDRYHIGFNFGFEQHVFFNMNRNFFGDFSYANYNGMSGRDFTMSGFALGARFDF